MFRRYKIILLLFLFFSFECTPLYQPHPPLTIPPSEDFNTRIEVRVVTQDRGYPLGGPVDLKLEVENISESVVRMNFDSNQLFDFKIFRRDWEIWSWSHDKVFEQTEVELYLYPGEAWSFQAEWDTKDNRRRYVLGGRYYIEGILNSSLPVKSDKIQIGLTD